MIHYDLVPDGGSKIVTAETLNDYLQARLRHRCVEIAIALYAHTYMAHHASIYRHAVIHTHTYKHTFIQS